MWHTRKVHESDLKSFLARIFPDGPPSSLIVTAWGQTRDPEGELWDYNPCFMIIWYGK